MFMSVATEPSQADMPSVQASTNLTTDIDRDFQIHGLSLLYQTGKSTKTPQSQAALLRVPPTMNMMDETDSFYMKEN